MTLPPENQREALARAAAEAHVQWLRSELAKGRTINELEAWARWNEANMNRREEDIHEHCDDHPCRECTIKSDLDAYDRAEEGNQ